MNATRSPRFHQSRHQSAQKTVQPDPLVVQLRQAATANLAPKPSLWSRLMGRLVMDGPAEASRLDRIGGLR